MCMRYTHAMGLLDTVNHITPSVFLITFNYPMCETAVWIVWKSRNFERNCHGETSSLFIVKWHYTMLNDDLEFF